MVNQENLMKGDFYMKTFAVTFLRKSNWKVSVDCFMGKSESDAKYAFRECYRHDNYEILAVSEVPEKPDDN